MNVFVDINLADIIQENDSQKPKQKSYLKQKNS